MGVWRAQLFLEKGTRAKQVDVVFLPTHLRIGLKGQPALIDGDLHEKILVDDCTWNLEVENGELTITLEVTKPLTASALHPKTMIVSACRKHKVDGGSVLLRVAKRSTLQR